MERWSRNCPVILPKFQLPHKFRDLLHATNVRHGNNNNNNEYIISIYIYIHSGDNVTVLMSVMFRSGMAEDSSFLWHDAVSEEWFGLYIKVEPVLPLPTKAPRCFEMSESGPNP